VICTLAPALAAGRTGAAQAAANGFGRPQTRPSPATRLALRLRVPAVVALGLKDAFARRARAVFTVCALVLAVVTLVFTLALDRTLSYIFSDPALRGDPYDLLITPRFVEPAEVERILAAEPGVAAFATREWLMARGPDNATLTAWVLGEGYESFDFRVFEGRMFQGPGEAIASGALIDRYGLELGEPFTLRSANGDSVTVTITGRYGDEDGRALILSKEAGAVALTSSLPSTYMVELQPGSAADEVVSALEAASEERLEIEVMSTGEPRESRLIRAAMYGLCAVLLGIALVNMVITAVFTVRERQRELGVLKALGITPAQLTLSVLSGMAVLTLFALVVGVPAGLWLTRTFYDAVAGEDLDASFYRDPTALSLALLVPFMLAVTGLAGLLPAYQVARQRVADALRYE
jgi:putative ABC transport system permease protein